MWVARDKNDSLYLWLQFPIRDEQNKLWQMSDDNVEEIPFYHIPDDLFPNITWEDEPLEVELIKVLRTTKPSFIKSGYPSKSVDEHFNELV